ncbi:MAG TPA: hypothetical protein VKS60_13675 [Stellaceae bacterium]|nr:hypothetical protein [Stellaceae bacterium]
MSARPFPYKAPTEAIEGAAPASLRRVSYGIAVAALVALLLGSKPLLTWINELPIGPVSDLMLSAAQAWDDTAEAVGLTWFGDTIRDRRKQFEGER